MSEQLYNPELHKIYESTKHLTDSPAKNEEPKAKLHRAMWHDEKNNQLKWWDQTNKKWRKYYESEFKITDEIMSLLPPESPVRGQLWLHNGVLCYYDGVTWAPVKALLEDGSQFSLDVFKNFLLLSPLWKIGNTIVDDIDIEKFKDEERKYLQGILDAKTDSMITGDGQKWNFDYQAILNDPKLPDKFPFKSKAQLVVPHVDFARMFIDHDLDYEKYEEVSKVCIQYDKNDLIHSVPSLVHINPGRMTKITKRIVKIDRATPKIQLSAADTEFYGFRSGSYYGDLLIPDQERKYDDDTIKVEQKDYTIVEDGILLSYDACQNYDYVLAISYEFSWMKNTGRMSVTNSNDETNSYYINGYNGPFSLFVEGFNYEDPYYTSDGHGKTITTKENTGKYQVSVLHVPKREYGYVRQIDINGRGVIRPLRDYVKPLVFVNGEAMNAAAGDVVFDDGLIYIPGAKQDMAWSVIDLCEEPCENNGWRTYEAKTETGTIAADGCIHYNPNTIADTDSAVLFVNGLLMKKEDVTIDRINHKISTAGGLTAGNEYILVEDKYDWLYDEKNLLPALSVGTFTDSLVYFNNKLICNTTAISASDAEYKTVTNSDGTKTLVPYPGVFNEVKNFGAVYDEVVEVPSKASLDTLIANNKGKHSADIQRDIEREYRRTNAAALNSGTISEEQAQSEIMKIQRQKVVKSGILYYITSTGDAYVGEKDDSSAPYDCSAIKIFAGNDANIAKTIHKNYAGQVDQVTYSKFSIYDSVKEGWHPLNTSEVAGLNVLLNGYENLPHGIRLILPYTAHDKVRTYAFNLATAVEHPLIIDTVDVVDADTVETKSRYRYGANTLRVWCNGIRQYPNSAGDTEEPNGIIESIDGASFKLPEKFTGKVTYVIELPENNESSSCSMEILDEKSLIPGYINMYQTKLSMFPGRVTVYINGIRQPIEAFTVYDNHTLMINDEYPLVGNWKNYPTEEIVDGNDRYILKHGVADKILVEVRQDNRQEKTIECEGHPIYDIDVDRYKLPRDILEACDEIMIFADGLFFGGTVNGDKMNGGYVKNIPRGCVTIRQEEVLQTMNKDELDQYLAANDEEKLMCDARYGSPYKRHDAQLILEWR